MLYLLFLSFERLIIIAKYFHFVILYYYFILFLLINLFFNWRIIALQNFVVFCQTSTWIIHRRSNQPEKAVAPYSSTLAWKIPWMEDSGRLQSVGLLRVGHDWVTSLSFFTFVHWRRKWQPTPVFLPGESQGRGSLVGCHLWGHTESDTTEAT